MPFSCVCFCGCQWHETLSKTPDCFRGYWVAYLTLCGFILRYLFFGHTCLCKALQILLKSMKFSLFISLVCRSSKQGQLLWKTSSKCYLTYIQSYPLVLCLSREIGSHFHALTARHGVSMPPWPEGPWESALMPWRLGNLPLRLDNHWRRRWYE